MSADGAARRWVVLLAVKPLSVAKSRLDRPDRSAITLAMAADTAAAAASVETVAAVLVVSDDEQAREFLAPVAVVVPDTPGAGLNPALAHAETEARRRWPDADLAVLAADLPALRPAALGEALSLAGAQARAIVADAGGTGTVLLTATQGAALDPRFGPGSRDRHVASGTMDLTNALPAGDASAGLRRDVDTAADLEVAVGLGVGPYTADVLGRADSFTWEWQTSRRG
jgi:2-phospho-L-lactate/phosphoenolpyruvate guanylyltransferase